jgi:hypothetical protein
MPQRREALAVNKDHGLSAVARALARPRSSSVPADIGNRCPQQERAGDRISGSCRPLSFACRQGGDGAPPARVLGKEGTVGSLTPGRSPTSWWPTPIRSRTRHPEHISLVAQEGRAVAGRDIAINRPQMPAPFSVSLLAATRARKGMISVRLRRLQARCCGECIVHGRPRRRTVAHHDRRNVRAPWCGLLCL